MFQQQGRPLAPALFLWFNAPSSQFDLTSQLKRNYLALATVPSMVAVFAMDGRVLHQNSEWTLACARHVENKEGLCNLCREPLVQHCNASWRRWSCSASTVLASICLFLQHASSKHLCSCKLQLWMCAGASVSWMGFAMASSSGQVARDLSDPRHSLQRLFVLEPAALQDMMGALGAGKVRLLDSNATAYVSASVSASVMLPPQLEHMVQWSWTD